MAIINNLYNNNNNINNVGKPPQMAAAIKLV